MIWYSHSKESVCIAGDPGSILGLGKIPWRKEWLPIPVFSSGKSHRAAWWVTVHGVAKSQTQLSD